MTNVLILGANGQIARNTTRVFLAHTDARLREIDAAASKLRFKARACRKARWQ